ncbi:galactokinase [Coemansia sp. RSA 2049]|nr:galactokinase [Coemansia sp. RSA 2049]
MAPIATFTALSDIYDDNLLRQGARYQTLVEDFIKIYGAKPTFIARVPGSVNIIGEQTDYCGFPALLTAIIPDCLIAVKAVDSNSTVRLDNVNRDFAACQFSYGSECAVSTDGSQCEWSSYFKCGYKSALDVIRCSESKGMQCLVDGNIPQCVGLSSSSALVCCAALATAMANDKPLSREMAVEVSVAGERHIEATSDGCMNRIVGIMSQPQSFSFVEDNPKSNITPVKLPLVGSPLTLVVANTLVPVDKHATAPVCYNLRVVETCVGALVLARHLGVAGRTACKNVDPLTFKIVMDEFYAEQDTAGRDDVDVWIERLEAMLEALHAAFGSLAEGYTREQMAGALGISCSELSAKVHEAQFPVRAERFQLLKRAQHVFSEALRVVRFRQICERENGDDADGKSSNNSSVGAALGDLMNQSQDSCRDQFECSCKELDEVCAIARRAGALGSRLTGAGWGGCSVHLVHQQNVDKFVDALNRDYYGKYHPNLTPQQRKDATFVVGPGTGAGIYTFED